MVPGVANMAHPGKKSRSVLYQNILSNHIMNINCQFNRSKTVQNHPV